MTSPVSDRDRELLSALLDGQLSAQEKNDLERRVSASPELAKELEQLRHLRMLMKELPRHKVRRNFYLKPGTVPERKPSPFLFPMRLVAGLASAALVILLALDATVIFRGGMLTAAAPAAASLAESQVMSAERAASGQMNNEIIQWVTPTVEAFGKGGGPSALDAGTMSQAIPAPPAAASPAASVQQATPQPEVPQAIPSAADSLEGQSPILGIPPAEQQGKVIEPTGEVATTQPLGSLAIHPAAEILIALIAIGCAIAAVFLGRRK
jgi:hypothetical protein